MTPSEPISRLDLERFVLGRLSPEATADLDARIAADPELEQRVARLRADIEAAAADLPVFTIPTEQAPTLSVVQTAPDPPPRRRSMSWVMAGTMLAAAAGVALVVLPGGPDSGESFRGSFDLEVQHVRAGTGSSVGALVEAREGDKLQYTITPSTDGWWMVADIQDNGEVSMWTPPRRVQAGQSASAAVQLDGYTGSERAYFIVSEQPLELDVVRAAYADAYRKPLADLDTLPGLPAAQRSILVVRTPGGP